MNKLDITYQQLLQDIIDYGVDKKDRTGTGTKSIFGYTIRHNMKDGFPLLTTKKMAWKSIVTELLWFLRGDTNIKYLVDNNCHIWDGDAYKRYHTTMNSDDYIENWVEPGEKREEARKNKGSNGYTKEEFINEIKTDDEFAKQWGELGKIYGHQWRSWEGVTKTQLTSTSYELGWGNFDQITNLINDLKTNPDSRRLMVNAWNVGELDEMVLPPCHYGFQVYTRELSEKERMKLAGYEDVGGIGQNIIRETVDMDNTIPRRAISLMWNQRSVDTFLGLPFNIASYGLLLEIIAKEVNMVPDQLIGSLGDVHLYSNHIEQAKEQIGREPFELPKLNINTEFWKTESGECGVGPLNTNLQGFESDDFTLENYQSHPAIKASLSN
jgi:thymidylate synthase